MKSDKKAQILAAVEALEAITPIDEPVSELHLPTLDGEWEVRFSTITILGRQQHASTHGDVLPTRQGHAQNHDDALHSCTKIGVLV